MSTREKIQLRLEDECAMLLEPEIFDAAIVGLAYRCSHPTLVAYDRQRIIEILVADGMTAEEAEEFFNFNIEGAWVGEGTPIFIDTRWAE